MPKLTADEVVTTRHKRNFIQFGGPKPSKPLQFAGQDGNYMAVEGVGNPELGGVDPIYVHDPRVQGRYRLIGRKFSAPDLASATVKLLERHGAIPRQLMRLNCAFNFYEPTGACRELSDFLGGWSDYVLIYSGAIVTDKDLGTRTTWDSDDQMEVSLSVTLGDVYPIGALPFGEKASSYINREVVDVVYGSRVTCGECGPDDDGSKRIYAVTASSGGGSPGLPAIVIYTTDGGLSWNFDSIDTIDLNENPAAIAVIGQYLVVLSPSAGTDGGYYYVQINSTTGAPSGAWTEVSGSGNGFAALAAGQPRALYVMSPREVVIVGDNGYIYKLVNPGLAVTTLSAGDATTNDLRAVDGVGDTLVAVAAATVIYSNNRGVTWSSTTTVPTGPGVTIQAVSAVSKYLWWVGTDDGTLAYTENAGETWRDSGVALTAVYDIVHATEEVMYVAGTTAGPTAVLYTSWNGGADFTNGSPRIIGWPVFDYPRALAVPDVDDSALVANNIAVAGLGGNGTDGILLLGIAPVN